MTSNAVSVEDRTVYPEEERVGEDILQTWIVELLRPLMERWLAEQGQVAFVGADQFIYFKQFDPHQRVAPDVYVLPGVEPDRHVRSWKTWETNVTPSFALEVVSRDWEKDYVLAPEAHEVLGTLELFVCDPHFESRRDGVRWQRFVRTPGGKLELVERTDGRDVFSEVLGCGLRVVGAGSKQRIRLVLDRNSTVLYPTAEEAERQAKEAERQAKEAAQRRVAELEALLKEKSR